MAKSKLTAAKKATRKAAKIPQTTDVYDHPESTVKLRPDIGMQSQFKKQKPAAVYRYDSSLALLLGWTATPHANQDSN